jgi:hypothetical protein
MPEIKRIAGSLVLNFSGTALRPLKLNSDDKRAQLQLLNGF